MNLDRVSEEEDNEEDILNLSFEHPYTSLRETLPAKHSKKSSSKKMESVTSRSSSKSVGLKHVVNRPSSGSTKSPPAPDPPPAGPGPGSVPPPPPVAAPPPPPPPPQDVKLLKPSALPKVKFSSKDLKVSKKKLRRAEEVLKMVDVERAEMFDKYKKYKFMPLVDSREHLRTLRAEIVSISFDGIEQVTDAFLFSLHHCKLSLNSLRWISLLGCYNITDEGVYWITQAFPTLKEIFLMGCQNLTEKALYYLLSSNSQLKTINMRGTDVGVVPPHTKDSPELIVDGCPVVSPAPACKNPVSSPSPYRKIVILTNMKIPWNLVAVLTNQKDISPKQDLIYHPDWSPFTEHKMASIPSSAKLFNIFQVPVELGISELVLSPGSIVILPYHLSDNVTVVEKTYVLKLTETIASILTKYADCTFVLLGLYKGSLNFDPVAKGEEVLECVRRRYHDWNDRLGNTLRISIHTNWRMAALNFQEQEDLGAGEKFLRHGKSIYKQDRQNVHQESNKPVRSLLGAVMNIEEGVNKESLKFLVEAVEADEIIFPWNRQKLQSQQVLEFGNKVQKNVQPLTKLESVIKQYKIDDIGNDNVHLHMAKLLSLAALTGHALYYPVLEEKAVVTDFKFLADVLHHLFVKSAPHKVDIRSLGKHIPCWTQEDVESIYPKSKATVRLLVRLLEKYGCLFLVPLDPWSDLAGVSYVYVLYKDFPEKPAIPIETYWVPELPVAETQKDKYYFCCPGLPESFFPNLLRHILRLGGVVLLWRDGLIIQKGYLTVLVEKIKDYQGLNVVLLQVRMPLSAQDNSPHLKTLWTTLKLYTSVLDYLMLKYKISAAKSVPCTACIPSTNRYTILESRELRRFFLEHLVRVGDQRDVRCKKCEAASIAYVQVGPYISSSSLVPNHDKTGVGIALPTTNNFNRCLMCENCAIEGIKCPVNLRNGTSSWYCGCNREGKLCNYCGMCQRCFMYIKRIISTLEPAFFTPKVVENVGQEQLTAFDTVNVVTKGSILGFIEVQKHEFDNEKMTPNYFPVLEVTFIQQSGILMELKMKNGDEDSIVAYNTMYGSVLHNDNVMVSNDVRSSCKEGDRVRITLDYCNNEYTEMLVKLECNDRHIYSLQVSAQPVGLTVTALQSGVSLQLRKPQKFSPVIKRKTQNNRFHPVSVEADDSKKQQNCSYTVQSLPSALEMKMYSLLENVEDVLFGERGISFTGAGMVALPSQLSMVTLQYPAMSSLTKVNYHHLCVTWNPKSGKKNVKLYKQRFVSLIKKEIKSELKDYDIHGISNVDEWNLSRLAHLLDSPGIPAAEAGTIDHNSSLLLWSWHYVLASYPKVFLPKNPNKLFPAGVYKDSDMIKIEEGLRQLFRLGFWKYFLMLDFSLIGTMYKSTGWGRKVEFLSNKNKLVAYALVIQELLDKHLDTSGLLKIKSKFNQKLELYLCPGHRHVLKSRENIKQFTPELHGDYSVFLSFIDLAYNKLEVIPEHVFKALPNLVDLALGFNHIEELPATIKHCKKLYSLQLMENDLTDLPDELQELENLAILEIGNNRFIKLPDIVVKLTSLTQLTFPYMMLTELPEDIGNLVNLKKLNLSGNCFTSLPKSFANLKELEEIQLSGVPWVKMKSSSVMSYEKFQFFLAGNRMERYIEANDRDHEELFQFFDENSNGVLDVSEVAKLNAAMYNLFPRLGYKGKDPPEESAPSGFPEELFSCTNLRVINLEYQGIVSIPPEIEKLTKLIELRMSNNPCLLSVPAELGKLNTLKVLDLENCPLLRTPPKEIRDKGFQSIVAYLQRLLSGALLSKRTKLMLVGLGGAGKTSLVRALMSKDGKADLSHGEDITDGIEINTWKISKEGEEITYNVWDFAGQTVYYNTHQFFLSNRAVYLLLWNVRLGYEHAGLDFWLSSISVQCPKVPIFVIGSHIDQVQKSELPIHEIQERYPQIIGFHFISSFTGQGVAELKEKLFTITLQQEYMGEHIPAVWLTFENNIAKNRAKQNVIEYNFLEKIANQSGIFDSSEIFQAVQFLHDLGTIQHFSNDYLKDKVVINPQWIVDVMACVVSVKSQVIKNGRLHHSDIADVWIDYPKYLHSWLLRLTQEFDLTFPLSNSPINLVPCLLPEKKPYFDWPEVEKGSDVKETQMIYKFDYLPAGLFNRGQVRLHHLSDSSLIWKKGSFLKKNVHIALIQQTRESELVVQVQGPRPENILFLVHEVFEGLIAESFHGVQYDFLLPCPECNRMAVKDQHLFAASTIRRAIDMKAPFLQCIKYFHTISCADLLTFLPPDSHSDFDAHLIHSVQGLKDLRKDLSADIFISHCWRDDNVDKNSWITPARVYDDLTSKGYKCWYSENMNTTSTDEMAKALIDCSVFITFVSSNYANMEECVNIFKYARLTLRKTMVVIAVGDGFEWKQSKIGILLADEVYINMTKQKFEHYDNKFEELLRALSGTTRMIADITPKPVVFFSYTWVNSEEAVQLGTREIPGALGYGDPRKLKAYLEKHGVSCWIDVERVGMNGLFDDIAEGLLSAKVVVVCVSDEYAASHTCQIEFRYAANTLKLPIIVAVVGTGDAWRATEVGLLSVYYPIVNFQEKTKNGKKKLLKLVTERLGEREDAETLKAQKDQINERNKNLSFQELFELAQRKLLRQLTLYAENQDTDIYPRLFLVDFVKEQVSDTELPEPILAENSPIGSEEEKNESEKADESEKTRDEYTEQEKPVLKQKPSIHSVLSKKSSTLQPAYKLQKFCAYILCEHEEGWHSVAEPLELPLDFGINYLESFSPYLARMTAVMKYSKHLVISCLEDEIGQDYIKWLEESPEATMSDYQAVYHRFREMVMEVDVDKIMGKLARCHLPNGKTIWLCPKHQQTARVTVLRNEEKTVTHKSDQNSKVYSLMIQALRSMDYNQYASQFKPQIKSKRKPHGGIKELKKASRQAHKKHKEEQGKKSKKKQQGPDITEDIDQETTHVTEAKQQLKTDTSMAPTGEKIATDRQISKDSVSTVSTEATSRQTSVTDRQVSRESATSLSAATDTNKTSLDQSVTERRTMRQQQSQDQASISSRESTASLQRHRDQQNYSQSTKHIQRAKTKSRACVLS